MRRLLTLAAVVLLLAGCESPPVYGPSPTAPVTPFFADEEEALAAVERFMVDYTAAVNLLYQSSGREDAPIRKLASATQVADEMDGVSKLAEDGETFVGSFGYFGVEVQQFHQDSATKAYLQAYVCIDYRQSSYVRADGTTFEGERDWAPFEAILTADRERELFLKELRFWTGRDFCEQRS